MNALRRYLAQNRISQSQFAEVLGIKQPSVSEWLRRQVPASRVLQVEEMTGGRVTRFELRPDIYPLFEAPPRIRRRLEATVQATV